MQDFLDIYDSSLKKHGEELCGDKVKVLRTADHTIIVLSDGLGSGVKANILATLTTEIIVTMMEANVSVTEVIRTVIGTLPICKVRQIAYATFTVIEIRHTDGRFRVMNFDNPLTLFFKRGKLHELDVNEEKILDKKIAISTGVLEQGDFLTAVSDGVLYAGLGHELNFGWGRDNIATYTEELFLRRHHTSENLVRGIIQETNKLYRGSPGDDATVVGIYVRRPNTLFVFTGPPLDPKVDTTCVERLLEFKGRRVICGGTTANIVSNYLGEVIETDLSTLRPEVPPIGYLGEVDLLTEGLLTMSHSLELMRECHGDSRRLPSDRNGAVLLARELLQADSIHFLVGLQINEFYQNPHLPRRISLRKVVVEEIAQFLVEQKKDIKVEYC